MPLYLTFFVLIKEYSVEAPDPYPYPSHRYHLCQTCGSGPWYDGARSVFIDSITMATVQSNLKMSYLMKFFLVQNTSDDPQLTGLHLTTVLTTTPISFY